MNAHGAAVESATVEHWAYRGGCENCLWRGPWRETYDAAQADAAQHVDDARRFPDPMQRHD